MKRIMLKTELVGRVAVDAARIKTLKISKRTIFG